MLHTTDSENSVEFTSNNNYGDLRANNDITMCHNYRGMP